MGGLSAAMSEIESLFMKINGSGGDEEREAVSSLLKHLKKDAPKTFLQEYTKAKVWSVRAALVFYMTPYAKESDTVQSLGLLALHDRSRRVRQKAALLLAVSGEKSLIPKIKNLSEEIPQDSKEDILAAIRALETGNQNDFVDRDGLKMIGLVIHKF
jgi:hypothetical protein